MENDRDAFDKGLKYLCSILKETYGVMPRPVYESDSSIQAFGFEVSPDRSDREMGKFYFRNQQEIDYEQSANDIFCNHLKTLGLDLPLEEQRDGELWLSIPEGVDGSDQSSLYLWVNELRETAKNKIPSGQELADYSISFLKNAGVEDNGVLTRGSVTLAALTNKTLIADLRTEVGRYLRGENLKLNFMPSEVEESFVKEIQMFILGQALPDDRGNVRGIDSMNLRETFNILADGRFDSMQYSNVFPGLDKILSSFIDRQYREPEIE